MGFKLFICDNVISQISTVNSCYKDFLCQKFWTSTFILTTNANTMSRRRSKSDIGDVEMRSLSMQPISNSVTRQQNQLRSQSVNVRQNNRTTLPSQAQDLFRRVRSVNSDKSGGSMTDVSSPDGTETFSTPSSRMDASRSCDEWDGVPMGSPSPGSGYSTSSSTPMVNVSLVPFVINEGSVTGSDISALPHSKEALTHSSPPSVLVSAKLSFEREVGNSGFNRSIISISWH